MNSYHYHHAMQRAIDEAMSNDNMKRARMAAVIAHRRKILAVGINRYQSHPMQAKFNPNEHAIYLHAEIDAIRAFVKTYGSESLKNCDMYVARVLKSGETALAKPCDGCKMAIATFELNDVHWTK